MALDAIKLDRQWPFAGVTLIELASPQQLSSTGDGSLQASRLPGLQEDKKTKRDNEEKEDRKVKERKSLFTVKRSEQARMLTGFHIFGNLFLFLQFENHR